MEELGWAVSILGGLCIYLFIRCVQLDTQITNAESKIRQEFRDTFCSEVRIMMVRLGNHVHDPTTGYVDRMSLLDIPQEKEVI